MYENHQQQSREGIILYTPYRTLRKSSVITIAAPASDGRENIECCTTPGSLVRERERSLHDQNGSSINNNTAVAHLNVLANSAAASHPPPFASTALPFAAVPLMMLSSISGPTEWLLRPSPRPTAFSRLPPPLPVALAPAAAARKASAGVRSLEEDKELLREPRPSPESLRTNRSTNQNPHVHARRRRCQGYTVIYRELVHSRVLYA